MPAYDGHCVQQIAILRRWLDAQQIDEPEQQAAMSGVNWPKQREIVRAYAAHASLEVVQDYCDVGLSGRREGRPQLNALVAAVRNHEIDCVLVWKFDRFARSTRRLLTALEEFNYLGVRFISPRIK